MLAEHELDAASKDGVLAMGMRIGLAIVLAAALGVALVGAGAAGEERPPVAMIRLEGAIDVPTAEYLERGVRVAQERGAQCLLILLNTPGGLGQPMKEMTETLLKLIAAAAIIGLSSTPRKG